jgi:glycerophosphoryl diester phosphodiesterase
MAAFRSAVAMRADMIELDVRLTSDAIPVVQHDRTLRRIAGWRRRVRDTPLAAMRDLDAGSWFAPRFAGERIPTLRDVLEWLPAGIRINIELKTDGDRRRRDVLVDCCLDVLEQTGTGPAALVSSFDHAVITRLHRQHSTLALGIIMHPVRDRARRPSVLARRSGARVVICSASSLQRWIAVDVRSSGLSLFCYGVNSVSRLRRVLRRRVNAVITDYPDRIRHELVRLGGASRRYP